MSLLRRLASHIAGSAPEWVLPNPCPPPVFWALSRVFHATTSFDAAVAVPGEIYSRAMNSLPHRNCRSVDAFAETRQTEWFLSARATRHSELGAPQTISPTLTGEEDRGLREEN